MKSGNDSRYQRQMKGKQGQSSVRLQGQTERSVVGLKESSDRFRQRTEGDKIDSIFGFDRLKEGLPKLGWLLNYLPISMPDESGLERSGMDLYFIDREGGSFKASIFYSPYFFIDFVNHKRTVELTQHLLKKFEGCSIVVEEKEDLDMPNHLSGKKHKFLKIQFRTVNEMMDAKSILRPLVIENQKRLAVSNDFYDDVNELTQGGHSHDLPTTLIVDLREHDVTYAMRVSIDLELRVGSWFVVTPEYGSEVCSVTWQKDLLELCEPRVLAFDIECEKSPLKFPNPQSDRIYMISYMVKDMGFLLINREIVSEDIENFEYTPKPHYPGLFTAVNLPDEESVLKYFIKHIQELRPHVVVTYNGDKFDWPYVEIRCSKYDTIGSLYSQLGIKAATGNGSGKNNFRPSRKAVADNEDDTAAAPVAALFSEGEYTGRCLVHLDAFCWVQRDSYLPQGNQGLKAVTKYKLGYDPVEVDPEDMLRFASERPHYMASYSVSDAVATYYLYTTYVHNFIFSLSTIIPLASEDVLRKGSGTLCEALLMVEAYRGNIVCPNKQTDAAESFHEGHLLENETYIGGHVECLEAGVFRADIPAKFTLVPSALQQLINNIDRDLTFTLEVEHGVQRSEVTNYDEVKQAIVSRLETLRDNPLCEESPIIYHLDVGAMYPNIILTNRLQPAGIVETGDCAACEFNRSENNCKRPMNWTWRGEYSPASKNEYNSVKRQLSYEKVTVNGQSKPFTELSEREQIVLAKARLKTYANKVYKKTKVTAVTERTSTVCMRENSFYVDTVKAFRDRRYDYKLLTKTWKTKKVAAEKAGDPIARKTAEDREVLMDSLQLAHKCILNSFYGYVMRKGARWRSMEMAGIVTHTGALLIRQARELVEQVGRPLELDTDGIWCILPASFPQDFKFKTQTSGVVKIGYPCAMLNADVHERYTNHQYQELSKSNGTAVGRKYDTHSECSIFFELDGPYKAMVLPASPEEGKLLKKKYVVFNFDGSIAELKGFELKRRGELELVKIFQSQVFEHFLAGDNLLDCYRAVGAVANQWLDVLDQQGENMDDTELLELISERKTISKTVEDYGDRKSTSLTTAGRLADFLGADMVKDKGLNCNLIISRLPAGAPVTERAIPVAIFSCEPKVKTYFLRKWLKDSSLDCDDFRNVVDWGYYKERLGKSIQKIITIPAGIQRVQNPCPRVEHPVWLTRSINDRASGMKQLSIMAGMLNISKNNSAVPGTKLLSSGDRINLALRKSGVSVPEDTSSSGTKKRVRIALHDDSSVGDMEDLASSKSPQKSGALAIARNFRTGSSDVVNVDEEVQDLSDELSKVALPLSSHAPESTEELQSWLSSRKSHWGKLRAERRADKALLSSGTGRSYGNAFRGGSGGNAAQFSNTVSTDTYASKKSVGVLDYVRNAQLAVTQHCWQVLELQETDVPGEFRVWALTTPTQLQCITMVVPRLIYVNVHGADAQRAAEKLGGVKVKRDLPHSKTSHILYEISVSELMFQRNEKALNMFLSDAQVEGVYESQVPLLVRGILNMGCITRCVNARSVANTTKFKLSDVELVHVHSFPYLEKEVASFKRMFVYYANNGNSSGSLGVLALFIVDTNNIEEETIYDAAVATGNQFASVHDMPTSARAFVWLINGRGAATLDSVPPLQRIYRKFQPRDIATVKFTSSFVSTAADAYRLCNERLTAYQRERHGPTLVVAQGGAMDNKSWRYHIPMLHELPLTVIPTNNSDNVYPAVGWQHFTCERLVQRFLIFPNWFGDRLRGARYAHVPVCNLGADALTTIIDVTFSRQLMSNRHLLWCSEGNNTPDIGSSDSAANIDGGVMIEFDGDLDSSNNSNSDVIINNSGVYRDVCIELDVYGLAVCSIMSSGELDAEGITALNIHTSTSSAKGTSTASLDVADGNDDSDAEGDSGVRHMEMSDITGDMLAGGTGGGGSSDASCARAFNIFKAMVTRCIEDVERRSDPISDAILTALYRYLCGYGNGLLSDPALHRVVYNLMTQLFKKLIISLKRLGTRVIYADFGRIIIATNKQDFHAANEYIEFILAAILGRNMFSFVQISIKGYWEQLLWLGPENFGGIPLFAAAAVDNEQYVEDSGEEVQEVVDSASSRQMVEDVVDVQSTEHGESSNTAVLEEMSAETAAEISAPPGIVSESILSAQQPADDNVVPTITKTVKIASIFAKKGTADSDQTMTVTTSTLPPSSSGGKSVAFKNHSSSSSTEYDFLRDLDSDTAINLNSIKNTYKSRSAARRPRAKKDRNRLRAIRELDDEDNELGEEDEEDFGSVDSDDRSFDSYDDMEEDYPPQSARSATTFDQYDSAVEEEDDDDGLTTAHWNLATYFPQGAAEYFKFIVGEFMLQYKTRRDEFLEQRAERLNGPIQYTQQQDVPLDDESMSIAVTNHMKNLITQRFTTKMLEIIDTLNLSYPMLHSGGIGGATSYSHGGNHASTISSDVFPRRAGSHLRMTSPALEFVKSATHVMSLDASVREEVATMKRMLLAQLRVREFSDDSQYHDPCLSFMLRDVICGFCSTCRDLDLLRDASLTCDDESRRWLCVHCGHSINTEEVENRLLDETDRLAAAYLLQDLRCSKSHRVSQRLSTSMSDLCEPLVMDLTQKSVEAKLTVLLRVAEFHGFDFLQVAVRDLLLLPQPKTGI